MYYSSASLENRDIDEIKEFYDKHSKDIIRAMTIAYICAYIAIIVSAVLFLLLYFGCPCKQ